MRHPPEELARLYHARFAEPSCQAICEHLETLRDYASRSEVVAEFGVETGNSTLALLMGQPKELHSFDIRPCPRVEEFRPHAGATLFAFSQMDSRRLALDGFVDLLFIDTDHEAECLARELAKHHPLARKWIILHDSETFWERNPFDGRPGMRYAVEPFLKKNRQWKIAARLSNNNGLTILERQ